jgi:hypothetical protein
VTLTLAVSGTAALRLVPNATSPNAIGGHSANSVGPGVHGATIGGGGHSTYPNRVTGGTYGTIGGGWGNIASAPGATIGGGWFNTAGGDKATIGGGWGNHASDDVATIGGGMYNAAIGDYATLAGGTHNAAHGDYATIAGGGVNYAIGDYATIAGGWANYASGDYATVGGGQENTASGDYATVGGGHNNKASGPGAIVGGGYQNKASGYDATVAGGWFNTASGDQSFAAGRRAKAVHQSTFVWADSTDVDYTSTITDQFAIRASNGVSLSVNAGSGKAVAVGERYRDNAIIAWARVSWSGSVLTNSFGVESVIKTGTGQYAITITAQTADELLLIPIAVAEIDAAPSTAGAVRMVTVNQTGPRTFEVYVNDGTFVLADNDFVFMVTGR